MKRPGVTTVILAGGQGTRIGGNKGLQHLNGRPLIAWVLDAVAAQSAEVLISANTEQDLYAQFGCPVVADLTPGFAGPLAGVQSALHYARYDWVVGVPCDTPYLPGYLISRLYTAINSGSTEAVVAVVEGRRQPAVALYRKTVLPKLDNYLSGGGRKVGSWLDTLQVNEVIFNGAGAFLNINSSEELAAANQSPE